jgi:hypothetical protein
MIAGIRQLRWIEIDLMDEIRGELFAIYILGIKHLINEHRQANASHQL